MRKNNKNGGIGSLLFCAYTAVFMSVMMAMGAAELVIPDEIAFINEEKSISIDGSTEAASASEKGVSAVVTPEKAEAKLWNIPIKEVTALVYEDMRLVPCGSIFGIKFFTKGVVVVGTSDIETEEGKIDPAEKAGLKNGDVVESVDGKEVNTVEDVAMMVENSLGNVITLSVERNGERFETSLLPAKSVTDGRYKSGLWIRDSTAGIGTVTYYDPTTGEFAGLGHGICDIDTGKLMPLLKGSVVDITLGEGLRGERGLPGELKGSFGTVMRGRLIGNTELGVFGFLDAPPAGVTSEALPIGLSSDIKEGEAEIYSTVDGGGVKTYKIEITKIYKNDGTNKNFVFSVKDKALIEATGGIVRGMSGSPIVQNGKLIGAVTHVMVNDPEKGYGVFIENMLGAAPRQVTGDSGQ